MYNCSCDDCIDEIHTLNLSAEDNFKELLNAGKKAFKHLHKNKGYKPADLKTEKPYQDLIKKTFDVFNFAITDNDMPEAMSRSLQNDAFLFGSLKANAQLFEASKLLLNEDGKLKAFSEVSKDFDALNVTYNKTYLESEYEFAVSSSQMASKWSELGSTERYNLQYRTAKDERVRASHQTLADITLPKDDAFWSSYYPPNGWRCRCTAVEVLKDKYGLSDTEKAISAGEKATTEIGKDGKNRLQIFRFNPGKGKVVFPPTHPYNKVAGSDVVKEDAKNKNVVNLKELIKGKTPTNADVKNVLLTYAKLNPSDFRNGLDDVRFSKSTSYLMQHSMSYSPFKNEWVNGSKISISTNKFLSIGFNPATEFKDALASIKKGTDLTFKQEISLQAMWHEILHAKTNTPPARLNPIQNKHMETVNEFYARKTYPEFIEKLGGKAIHQKQILDEGYGYKEWISDFRNNLKTNKIDEDVAAAELFKPLMKDYRTIGKEIEEFFSKNSKQQ